MSQRWENYSSIHKRSRAEKERKIKGMTVRALNRNNDSVSKSIVRGKAALAEAENHIKMFEDYLRNSSIDDTSHDHRTKKNVAEEQISSSHYSPLFLDEMYSSSPSDQEAYDMVPNNKTLNDIDYGLSTRLINEMIKEGERRQQRDNRITVARYEGNIFPRNKQNGKEKIKPTKKKNFDPKNLAVAKRAIVKTAITAQEIAHYEIAMKKKSQFKARPLPGGNYVKNDPYALTRAAIGKVSKAAGNRSDTSTFSSQNTRIDASLLLNRPQSSSCQRICSEHSPIPKPQYNIRKQETMKKAVYDQISETIATSYNDDGLNQSEEELSSQDEQDLANLHQQISKLQAELNMKRIQCIKTIEEIDKYSPESYVGFLDGEKYISKDVTSSDGEKLSNSHQHSDHEKEECLIHEENECIESQINVQVCHKSDHIKFKHKNIDEEPKKSSSLYHRHCLWLQMREEKRMHAKAREEKELVKGVTGKPNLHGAKESWIKAKQQHDGLVKSSETKDKLRKAEKDEKERQIREKHMSEIERLQTLAKEKNREGKCGIDKRKQSEYLDKLARPNSRLKVESKVKSEELSKEGSNESTQEKEAKTLMTAEKERSTGIDLSFADMDDKQFSKMIKNLKAKASKGKHTTFGNQDNNDDLHKDIVVGKKENENSLERPLNNECDENEKIGNEVGDGHFTSSIAQANIYAQISGRTGESNSCTQKIETTLKKEKLLINKHKYSFPYERYDAGDVPFFDRSSSSDRGRFRVHDAREFHTDSLRRIPVPFDSSSCDGVMFLVGKKHHEEKSDREDVVTILFDRSKFDEQSASTWWKLNREQII